MLVCSISNLTWNKKLGTTHSNRCNDFEMGSFLHHSLSVIDENLKVANRVTKGRNSCKLIFAIIL